MAGRWAGGKEATRTPDGDREESRGVGAQACRDNEDPVARGREAAQKRPRREDRGLDRWNKEAPRGVVVVVAVVVVVVEVR